VDISRACTLDLLLYYFIDFFPPHRQVKQEMGDIQKAHRLRSPTYQEILNDVRKNDADRTALAAFEYSWPVGYGRERWEK
jgi:hypothetical protein